MHRCVRRHVERQWGGAGGVAAAQSKFERALREIRALYKRGGVGSDDLHRRSIASLCDPILPASLSRGTQPSGPRQSADHPGAGSGLGKRTSQTPKAPWRDAELLLSGGCMSWTIWHPTPNISIGYRRMIISTQRGSPTVSEGFFYHSRGSH